VRPGKFYTLFYTRGPFLGRMGRFWAFLKSRKWVIVPLKRRQAYLGVEYAFDPRNRCLYPLVKLGNSLGLTS
jgi:hypothetical protein